MATTAVFRLCCYRRTRPLRTAILVALVLCGVFLLLQYLSVRDHRLSSATGSPAVWRRNGTLTAEFARLNSSWFEERQRLQAGSKRFSDFDCVLPDLNPFHPEVMRHFKKEPAVDCRKAMDNWVQVTDGKFRISSSARAQYGDITCKYIPIVRESDYAFAEGSPVSPMLDGAQVTSDFFKVECSSSSGRKYSSMHSGVARKEDVFKRLESFGKGKQPGSSPDSKGREGSSGEKLSLNVFMLGFDSMSRMSWLRNLVATREHFVYKLGAVELEGYNIVGDGTPAAFLPILTGHEELELPEARRGHKGATTVDGHPWIWKDFKRSGYVTGWAEDLPGSGTFTYRMLGFKDQPTDHYMRTYFLAAERQDHRHPPLCLGSVPRHVNFMNWFRDLFRMYRGFPKAFVGFHAELSHGSYTMPQVMDQDVLKLLKDLEEEGHLNHTLLILMADHGARFNHIRAIPQGKLEERNPYFGLRFPPWFLRQYPDVLRNLKTNARRLTTPFDIHATLHDLLNLTTGGLPSAGDGGKASKGMSLFREIPPDRTCSQAGVAPHWCACLDWQPISASDERAVKAVQAALDKINALTAKQRHLCAELVLHEVTRTLRYVPSASDIEAERKTEDFKGSDPMKTGLLKDAFLPPLLASPRELYQVSFFAEPGHGHFEVTVTLDVKSGKIRLNDNDISRMNKYGSAPACLNNKFPFLNPFCYCK